MWHLAEINVGRLRAAIDDPSLADFVAQLEPVNRLADASPGFVWRLASEPGSAVPYHHAPGDDRLIVNMSVWTSVEALIAYVYRGDHGAVYRARSRWFEPPEHVPFALWWVPEGHRPSLSEGLERLEELRRHGPTRRAFTLKHRFEPGPQ